MTTSRDDAEALDRDDPLRSFRDRFEIPDGLIYLDGNSLGALPRKTPERVAEVVREEWGKDLIAGWNTHDWISAPQRAGAKIARLIGAKSHEVIGADSVSVNIFKLAAAALKMRPGRRVIVSEKGNFPTDLYMLQGLAEFAGAELRAVERGEVVQALDEDVALLLLTHAHYKTGELYDMDGVTEAAHASGALTLWDLSHSTGALEVDLNGARADFAVGCGYKYLNGGPGAPAFLYAAERHHNEFSQPLSGWMGHKRPFEFIDDYEPGAGMDRALAGTPPILAFTALEAGLETFDGVEMHQLRTKSRQLGDLFLTRVKERCAGHGLKLACPEDSNARGSQVSLAHEDGYAVVQALIERGVVGDFRSPDILRFGFAPLYLRYVDVYDAVEHLAEVLETGDWREERFQTRAAVT